jgi:hypothetical protein
MQGCVCHQQLYSAFGQPVNNNKTKGKIRKQKREKNPDPLGIPIGNLNIPFHCKIPV